MTNTKQPQASTHAINHNHFNSEHDQPQQIKSTPSSEPEHDQPQQSNQPPTPNPNPINRNNQINPQLRTRTRSTSTTKSTPNSEHEPDQPRQSNQPSTPNPINRNNQINSEPEPNGYHHEKTSPLQTCTTFAGLSDRIVECVQFQR